MTVMTALRENEGMLPLSLCHRGSSDVLVSVVCKYLWRTGV